jgi:hypothetical protein
MRVSGLIAHDPDRIEQHRLAIGSTGRRGSAMMGGPAGDADAGAA